MIYVSVDLPVDINLTISFLQIILFIHIYNSLVNGQIYVYLAEWYLLWQVL